MSDFPFDGQALWERFFQEHGTPRDDHRSLHLFDLSGCLYATHLRLRGEPELPRDDETRGRFFLGHAVEGYLAGMLEALSADGWRFGASRGRAICELRGVIGHPDYILVRDGVLVVLDPSTTSRKTTDIDDGHAMKTAAYALALGAQWGAELVIRLAAGRVAEAQWHWINPEDYRERIEARIATLKAIEAGEVPPMQPPEGQTWRCRSYCDMASCPRNERVEREEVISEWSDVSA